MRLSRNCFNVMPKWTLFSYPRAPAQQVPDGLMCYFCLKSIAEFDKKVNHVLETFCDYFESLPDQFPTLPPDFDVFLQDGVLTMNLGGSYVDRSITTSSMASGLIQRTAVFFPINWPKNLCTYGI
ncbi:Frataxin [Trichinella pseudospiralis]